MCNGKKDHKHECPECGKGRIVAVYVRFEKRTNPRVVPGKFICNYCAAPFHLVKDEEYRLPKKRIGWGAKRQHMLCLNVGCDQLQYDVENDIPVCASGRRPKTCPMLTNPEEPAGMGGGAR